MKKTHYTIVQAPDKVTCKCPHCGAELEEEWDAFLGRESVEYEVWNGRLTDNMKECEECGKYFEFEGVDID